MEKRLNERRLISAIIASFEGLFLQDYQVQGKVKLWPTKMCWSSPPAFKVPVTFTSSEYNILSKQLLQCLKWFRLQQMSGHIESSRLQQAPIKACSFTVKNLHLQPQITLSHNFQYFNIFGQQEDQKSNLSVDFDIQLLANYGFHLNSFFKPGIQETRIFYFSTLDLHFSNYWNTVNTMFLMIIIFIIINILLLFSPCS